MNWSQHGSKCRAMDTEEESYCCMDTNENYFKGLLHFQKRIHTLYSYSKSKMEEEAIRRVVREELMLNKQQNVESPYASAQRMVRSVASSVVAAASNATSNINRTTGNQQEGYQSPINIAAALPLFSSASSFSRPHVVHQAATLRYRGRSMKR